jgi:hypothetical protein
MSYVLKESNKSGHQSLHMHDSVYVSYSLKIYHKMSNTSLRFHHHQTVN